MLLITISIRCYKRAMIKVEYRNSVDLLNMQTYCQVTSKKKKKEKIEYISSSYPLL